MRWPYKGLRIEWSEEKNVEIMRTRGVSFDDVELAIEEERIIDIVPHWNAKKYAHQQIIVLILNGYIHVVPCVIDDEKVFLKTIFANRDVVRKYLLDDKEVI